ncbi:MAG TPA: DUF4258 domain-containing protein [bacterium]|nr:DUF4258 domain-containing protein [bacterium]HQL61229.1 DUF4258 domain-containing protein [bacterium]
MAKNTMDLVRAAAEKRLLFLPHAMRQMSRFDPMITTEEVAIAIRSGEIVEDYPEDVRGHSCLMMGVGQEDRPVHIVCSPKTDYLAIITAYLPDTYRWDQGLKRRLK